MGIKVVLESEDGKPVEDVGDPTNILHRLLPSPEDKSFQYLRFIDWYGDTVFNRLQMESFLAEWKRLATAATTVEDKNLITHIENLAIRCQKEPHLYLKFYGD